MIINIFKAVILNNGGLKPTLRTMNKIVKIILLLVISILIVFPVYAQEDLKDKTNLKLTNLEAKINLLENRVKKQEFIIKTQKQNELSKSEQWDMQRWSGICGAIIGVIITIIAMFAIEWQNKKRWEKDSFQKIKNEYLVSFLDINHTVFEKLGELNQNFEINGNFIIKKPFIDDIKGLELICKKIDIVFYKNINKQISKKILTVRSFTGALIRELEENFNENQTEIKLYSPLLEEGITTIQIDQGTQSQKINLKDYINLLKELQNFFFDKIKR